MGDSMAGRKREGTGRTNPVRHAGLISIILSFRNEKDVLADLIVRLDAVLGKEPGGYELIFVNDDSNDGSLDVLMAARTKNPRVKIINMSRRFGQPECVMAGLAHVTGDAAIIMDADLQDPPEVIPDLLDKWRNGADVVYTVRSRREGENAFKMWLTAQAYRAINLVSEVDLPVNAGDFRLISKRVCDELLKLPETDPYARGLISWVGYRQEAVHYTRAARAAGETHHSLLRSIVPYKVFITGVTSFSLAPIFLIFLIGGSVAAVALVGLLVAAVVAAGLAVWVFFALLLWGSLLFALGWVGIYVGRIFKDVRGRPRYIIKDTIGL
jgi:dolichol-phosphate mannosyltransferase